MIRGLIVPADGKQRPADDVIRKKALQLLQSKLADEPEVSLKSRELANLRVLTSLCGVVLCLVGADR